MTQARVELLADSRQVRRATDDLERLERRGKSTTTAATTLRNAFIALGGTLAARRVIQYADAYTSVQNQLKIVTDSSRELANIQRELLEVANNTRSELESTAGLYATLARNTTELNISQDRLVRITDIINKSFAASGATAQEAAGAIRQLSQGLAAGALRGDEFNSVAEGAPEILRAVAAETGKTIGELREFAAEGQITSELLIRSLENYGDTIDDIYDKSERTFGQSLTVANNNITTFIGEVESGSGVIGALGDGIVELSENIDTLATAGGALAVIFGSRLVSSAAESTAAFAAKTKATVASTGADLNAARAAQQRALSDQAAAQRSLAVAANANLSSAAITRLAKANQAAIGATNALTAAQANYNRVASVGAIAARGLSSAMALIGGPVGVALLAGYALIEFSESAETAQERSKRLAGDVDDLKESFEGLTEAQLRNEYESQARNAFVAIPADIQRAKNEINSLQEKLDEDIFFRLSEDGVKASTTIIELKDRVKELEGEQSVAEAAAATLGDRLANLGDKSEETAESIKSTSTATKELDSNFESLAQSLRAQIIEYELGEEAGENYRLMSQLNAGASREEAEALSDLYQQLQQVRQKREQQAGMVDPSREIELPSNVFDQLEQEREAYDNSKALAKEAADYVIEQETRKANEVTALANSRLRAEQQVQSQALGLAQSTFGAIADTVKRAKGEESAAYKVAFAAQKAAAIAQAIINTESAAVAALAPPPIGLGPVAGAGYAGVIRGLGYASIGVMAGQAIGELAGGRAAGGQVLAGNEYLVGERGPEIVRMNTNGSVVPNSQLRNEMNNSGGGVNVNVQNYGSNQVQVKDRGRDPMTGKQVVDIMVSELGTHGSRSLNALNKTTNVSTRTA